MKKITTLIIALFSLASLSAQQKFDTVYMMNNEVKVGSIKSIDDAAITFVHQGETLVYTLKKSDISKIVFSSGRVENVNAVANTAANNSNSNANVDHHNKVAIMPFGYINAQQETNIEMGYKVQDECYGYLNAKAASLNIQDPSTTNALLGKAGVKVDNVRSFTNTELCNILGVEYLLRGTITTNMTNTTSSGNASYSDGKVKSGSTDKNGTSASSSSGNVYSSTTSQQNYKTSVLMEIYMDDGKQVFSQERTSFWQSVDAYKNTIQYLLKKSPVYGR